MRPQQPLVPTWIRSFGGVCQSPVGEHVPLGLLANASNYELSPSGELVPQRGRKRLTDVSTPDGTPVRVIAPIDFDGTTRLLVASDSHVYEVSGDSWAEICDLPASPNRPTFALFNSETNPFVVFGHENMDLTVWNGTITRAAGGGAPRGRPVNYNNYLVVFGVKNNPGLVQFSINNGDPDVWEYGGTIRGIELQGTVTSVVSFNGLLMMTNTRSKLFVGDPSSPDTASLHDISDTIGCVCHESVAHADGGIIWASMGRINAWSGGGSFPTMDISNPGVGEPSSATNPRPVASNIAQDLLEISWGQPALMSGVFWPEKKYYLFSAQNASGTIKTWCFNLDKRAWFPWTTKNTAMAYAVGLAPLGKCLAGDGTGTLYEMGENQFYDDNKVGTDPTLYSWYADLLDWDMGHPTTDKIVRGIFLGSRGVGKREFAVTMIPNFETPKSIVDVTEFILGVNVLGDRLTGETIRSSATASVNPGGLGLNNDLLGSTIAEEKTYTKTRVPIASRGVNFRVRMYADPSSITAESTYDATLGKTVWKLFKSDKSLFVDAPFGTQAEASGAIANYFAVPIAALCVLWRLYGNRDISIEKHLPGVVVGGPYVSDTETATIATSVVGTFKNLSSNRNKATGWKWLVDHEGTTQVLVSYATGSTTYALGTPTVVGNFTYTHDPFGGEQLAMSFPTAGSYTLTLKALVDSGPPITLNKTVVVT